jgi:hypothetical protein
MAVGDVVSHDAWRERIDFYEAEVAGRWDWRMKSDTAAVLTDPEGEEQAAVVPDLAPGFVAALNTVEGRAAFARARLDLEGDDDG